MKSLILIAVLLTGCSTTHYRSFDQLGDRVSVVKIKTCPYPSCEATRVNFEHGFKVFRKDGTLAAEVAYENIEK